MTAGWASGALIASCAMILTIACGLSRITQNAASSRRLALALVILAGMISVYPLGWTGRAEVAPAVAFLPFNLPLALGPLLYGYVHAITLGKGPAREWSHFIPVGMLFLYLVACLCLPTEPQAWWKDVVHDKLVKPGIEAAMLVSLASYSLASLLLLRRYRAHLAQTRSDADLFGARWITAILIGLTATFLLLMIVRLYTWYIGELDGTLLQLWLGATGAYLAVEGWRHAELHFPTMSPVGSASAPEPLRDWSRLGAEWRERTETAGWWRDEHLTLADLANRLGTNSAYLSRAINEGLGINFNEMVNRMRALEVARQIDEGGADRLTQAALEAGFSSKATFNRAFRAACGMSPSAWRARLRS